MFSGQSNNRSEDPQDNFFLRSRDVVPLKSDFKPAMKVLSRKPASKPTPGTDPALGLGQLSVEDDDDDDEDEANKTTLTAEERKQKAQRERDEKQKKYEEVRQKLFGSDENSAPSGPVASTAKRNGDSRNQSRNKRGGDSRPSSSASNRNRQLYDPNDTTRSSVLKKETMETPEDIQPIRNPRNPDSSGRGGFAPRGGRTT